MSGFRVEPDVLLDHARRRERDASTLDGIGGRFRGAGADGMALGAACAWVLGDLRDAIEATEELVRALAGSSRELATALRVGVEDHRSTDERVARSFGGAS